MSVDRHTTFSTPSAMAACSTLSVPMTLVRTASMGKNSHEGTCLSAAAWKTWSTPRIASRTDWASRTSPMKNRTLEASSGLRSCSRWRMSSCFFSSREKMRISPRSVSTKCLSTVLPKLPVPPVIMRVLPANEAIYLFSFFLLLPVTW